jgi:hypothetical protein
VQMEAGGVAKTANSVTAQLAGEEGSAADA